MKKIEELVEKLQEWTWKSTGREKDEEKRSLTLILLFVDYTRCFGMERSWSNSNVGLESTIWPVD